MAGLSNYAEGLVLNFLFGGAAATAPSARYASLHTGDPGETGASELASSGYARQVAAFTDAAGAGAVENEGAIQWTNSSGNPWTEVTHFGIFDASASGNFLGGGQLSAAKTIANGDTATFADGDLDVTLD